MEGPQVRHVVGAPSFPPASRPPVPRGAALRRWEILGRTRIKVLAAIQPNCAGLAADRLARLQGRPSFRTFGHVSQGFRRALLLPSVQPYQRHDGTTAVSFPPPSTILRLHNIKAEEQYWMPPLAMMRTDTVKAKAPQSNRKREVSMKQNSQLRESRPAPISHHPTACLFQHTIRSQAHLTIRNFPQDAKTLIHRTSARGLALIRCRRKLSQRLQSVVKADGAQRLSKHHPSELSVRRKAAGASCGPLASQDVARSLGRVK